MRKAKAKKFTNEELLKEWEEEKGKVSGKEFAKRKGITYKQLDNALYQARKKRQSAQEVEDRIDGNYRHLASKTTRIKTIAQLIKACEVDLDEWQIEDRPEIGTWEMGRRAEQKSIIWDDGKIIQGKSEDTGKLWIETLYRLRVTLVRKKPKAVMPFIEPVRFVIGSGFTRTKAKAEATGKILVVPDSQMGFRRNFQTGELIPFHDRQAHDIVMQVAENEVFDHVIHLGDGLDFTEWTDKFVGEPEFYYTTRPAIIEYAWFLKHMKNLLPFSQHHLIKGNHDERVNIMLKKHMMSAFQLKPATATETENPYSLEHLLGLNEIGISLSEDYPNGEVRPSGTIRFIHDEGVSSAPGGTASKMVKDAIVTTIGGHNHRLEMATKTVEEKSGPRYITAATAGCLCHLDFRVPGHRRSQNWQQGFAVVHGFNELSPRVELISIANNKAYYNGREYFGVDYSERLSEETGWNF